jgi:hypothetical protein
MTFEEMQAVIAGMLEVQRNLQEGQIRDRQDILLLIEQGKQISSVQRNLQESQIRDRQDIELMLDKSRQQERMIDRLIGYSLSYEADKLDLEQRMTDLERKRAERGQ